MKKVFAIAAVAAMFVACAGNATQEKVAEDSAKCCAKDTTAVCADTTKCCADSTKCCEDSTKCCADSTVVRNIRFQ